MSSKSTPGIVSVSDVMKDIESLQLSEASDIQKLASIAADIANLKLWEASDLNKILECVLKVSHVPVAHAAQPHHDSGQSGQSADVQEKTEFAVELVSFDSDKKISIIKEVRSITGLGLKDAKSLVESLPSILKEGVSKEDAQDIKKKIESIGASIQLK